MSKKESKISVFEYRDYRAFLRAWYDEAKKSRASYSFRSFSKKAGFHSSNFMMLVMKGKRNLTEESLKKFVVGLGLNKQEGEFFRSLVFFNQAQTHEDKNFYYQRLLQSKKFSQLKPIEKQQYEYYSSWYHPAVRELVVSKEFDGTPSSIAGRLFPSVSTHQVEKSIELLEKLELIKKTGNGRWKQTSSIITTGPELTSVVVHNYHKVLLDLSKEIMDRISMNHRDVSSMTLGVKRQRLPQLRAKIREFRQEILKLVANDTEPEEVALLNIQFYPATKMEEGSRQAPSE